MSPAGLDGKEAVALSGPVSALLGAEDTLK
jgi:hypothetical protein